MQEPPKVIRQVAVFRNRCYPACLNFYEKGAEGDQIFFCLFVSQLGQDSWGTFSNRTELGSFLREQVFN